MVMAKFLPQLVHVCVYVVCSAAAYTYYRSLNQEESLRRRGKQGDRKRIRRRRERLVRVSIGKLLNCVIFSFSAPVGVVAVVLSVHAENIANPAL